MITIPTRDFVGVLNDVIPFACTEVEIPALCCVRIEWDGERLHALTTDRYRIGWATWEPGDVEPDEEVQDDLFTSWGSGDEPWQVTLPLDEAKELAKVFKLGPKEGYVPITVDYDDAKWTLTVNRSRDTGHSAIKVVAPDQREESFPDVRALLAKNDALKETTSVNYNAKYMADFAKVRPMAPMLLRFTEGLTHVSIGERFVGAIMPVRSEE